MPWMLQEPHFVLAQRYISYIVVARLSFLHVAEEVHHAKEEGVIFDLLTNPIEILVDEKDWVTGIKCVRMELGEPDASGRRRPVEIPGSEFDDRCRYCYHVPWYILRTR